MSTTRFAVMALYFAEQNSFHLAAVGDLRKKTNKHTIVDEFFIMKNISHGG